MGVAESQCGIISNAWNRTFLNANLESSNAKNWTLYRNVGKLVNIFYYTLPLKHATPSDISWVWKRVHASKSRSYVEDVRFACSMQLRANWSIYARARVCSRTKYPLPRNESILRSARIQYCPIAEGGREKSYGKLRETVCVIRFAPVDLSWKQCSYIALPGRIRSKF